MEKKILSYLLKSKVNFWETASHVGPMAELVGFLKKMEKDGTVKIINSDISLTSRGRKKAKFLKVFAQDLPKDKNPFKIDSKFLEKFKNKRKKGLAKEEFDQLQLLPVAVIRKIEVMKNKGDLEGKKIVCLGDDDMVGIALALTKLPLEIRVLDIDKDIIDYENKIFKQIGVNAEAYKCNLFQAIPSKFKNKYNVFVTEPPDTVFGNSLFFSKGVECIKKQGGVGYIGISKTDFSRKDYLAVEKNILKMGALITDIFNKLEPYETGTEKTWVYNLPENFGWPNKPWFFSDLLRIEILKGAKPMFPGTLRRKISKKIIETNIYC